MDCLSEISEAVTRTAKIIRHLRAFTKSKPLQFESVNLNCVVRDAAEMIAYETRRAQVNLRWELAIDLPLVRGDQVQLEQVCVNLLMNAYEAMIDTPIEQRHLVISTSADIVTPIWLRRSCSSRPLMPNIRTSVTRQAGR